MALVLDPTTGQLVDDGTGPAFGLAASARERVQAPLTSGAQRVPARPAVDPQLAAARSEAERRRANAAVLEQDRANLRQAGLAPVVGPQMQEPPQTTLAGVNQAIAQTLEAGRAPTPIAGERGNYNMANTSTVDTQGNITSRLRQPDNIIEGGYGGFGGGRAQAYLSQFAAPRQGGMSEASDEVRLRNQLASENPFERRAAREQVANRQALQLDAGATQRTAMQLGAEQQRAQLSGLAALQAAQTTAAGRQAAAQLDAQSRVEAARATSLGRLGAAQISAGSGANSLSQVRAEQTARQLAVAQAAEEAGDLALRDRALGISQGAPGRVQTDALGNPIGISTPTGVRPLTPEEIASLRAASAQYSVPAQ